MKDFLRKYGGFLIVGVVVLVLIATMIIQISHPPAVPALTQPPLFLLTPSFTLMVMPTQTPSHTATPTQTHPQDTRTPLPTSTCSPDQKQIQSVLETAIPKQLWGIHFRKTASFSELNLFVVNNGETKAITFNEPNGDSWSLDLARFYYLHMDGTLDSLWATIGFAPIGTPSPTPTYYTFNNLPDEGWSSSQEAFSKLSIPGQVFDLTFPEVFIYQDGIRWNECRVTMRMIPEAACRLGLILDPRGSSEFFSRGVPPADWFAFGWYELPNDRNGYPFPFPNTVTLPEACP